MPVMLFTQPDQLAQQAAALEAAGHTIVAVSQLHDGVIVVVTCRHGWPPTVETRADRLA